MTNEKRLAKQLERKLIAAADKRKDLLEGFISKFMSETGLRVDQLQLCEQMQGGTMRWWIEKKEEDTRIVTL